MILLANYRRAYLTLTLSFLFGCQSTPSNAATPKAPPSKAVIHFETAHGTISIGAELAITPEARNEGLMNRKEMAQNRAMLFVFPEEKIQSFWMKNTYIALDMIFVNAAHRIVGIIENAEPQTLTSRSVPFPASYVIEVNAGFCNRYGISLKTDLSFEGLPKKARH